MTDRKREVLGLALILGVVGGVAFAAYAAGIPLCLFHHFTGLSCPLCGTTRACVALFSGNVAEAFALNPLAAACVFLGPFLVWAMTRPRPWPWGVVVSARILAGTALACNWAYLLFRDLSRHV